MKFNSDLLKKLTNTYSPSGNECKIRELIKNEIKPYVDEIKIDTLGNLIARKKGNGHKIMVAAHMDQIGLMVIDIDDNGFLRFARVGGISPYIALGQKVIFENGTIGIIFKEYIENMKDLKLENMYIDIGAKSREEAEKLVSIGDICVYHSDIVENENRIISKCLDDRIGCYVLIETIKLINSDKNDLYFVFTAQEEVGLRGAKTSAYGINPDIGISIDVTGTGDTPKAKRFAISLDKGTAIKVMDRSVITHPKVKKLMIETAKENNIPYQMEVLEAGGTDSGAIHLTRSGVPSGVISIPTRYVHTSHEMASKTDINNSIKLLYNILNNKIDI